MHKPKNLRKSVSNAAKVTLAIGTPIVVTHVALGLTTEYFKTKSDLHLALFVLATIYRDNQEVFDAAVETCDKELAAAMAARVLA